MMIFDINFAMKLALPVIICQLADWQIGQIRYTRVGQSGAARTIFNVLWKRGLPRTCVPVMLLIRNHQMCSVR